MKLKVELSQREDNHSKKYIGFLLNKNIIVDDDNLLPGFTDHYIKFFSDYSPIYTHKSNGIVNTRIRYPDNYGEKGKKYVYCKLNYLQRQKLYLIEKRHWIQNNDNVFKIINPIATGLFGFIMGYALRYFSFG